MPTASNYSEFITAIKVCLKQTFVNEGSKKDSVGRGSTLH